MAILFSVLATVALVAVLIGRPWTILPAKRMTDPADWDHPLFRETNMVISLAWAALFALAAAVAAWGGGWAAAGMGCLTTLLGIASADRPALCELESGRRGLTVDGAGARPPKRTGRSGQSSFLRLSRTPLAPSLT